jgi:hypothetical protein
MRVSIGLPICFILQARPDIVSNKSTLLVLMLYVCKTSSIASGDCSWVGCKVVAGAGEENNWCLDRFKGWFR